MNKRSSLLRQRVIAFVALLSDEMIERILEWLPTFVGHEHLRGWSDQHGPRYAVGRAMMELAKAEIGEGIETSMMQYLRFKHARLGSAECAALDFDDIERTLLTDPEGSDAKAFLADIWTITFVQRFQRQFVGQPVIELTPN